MKSINIKGKEYIEVNERIKYFRENFKSWSLESEIVSLADGICVIKATIKDENQVIKATGLAYEKENSTFINKTSYIENCETSAWGRALGNLGIGIDTSIASAEEVQNAINNQNKTDGIIVTGNGEVLCPVCNKKTTEGALKSWGKCAECYRKEKAGQ